MMNHERWLSWWRDQGASYFTEMSFGFSRPDLVDRMKLGRKANILEIGCGYGRELAAWIGLVPKQSSTGGKERMGRISKQGDRYLRWLLVAGAMSVIRHGRKTNFEKNPWLADLVRRTPAKVAAVALANKNARTAWALLVRGETYKAAPAA